METFDRQRNIHQQVILEHAKKPRNRGVTNPVHSCYQSYNPYCGDKVEISLELTQDGESIEDIKFQGEGCAIALASTDLMAEVVQGKSIDEALEMVQNFCHFVKGEGGFPSQQKLSVFQNLSQFPVRVKCATLGWHALKHALNQVKRSP